MKSIEECDHIYSVVASIPRGKVATYGQVAEMAGLPGRARLVGYALRMLPDGSGVPWHRVINAQGEISSRGDPKWEREQRLMLEEEGVEFGRGKRVSLKLFRWEPESDGW
jgi:methylated-DNA-protein-cysteine methyltransferase-like protein